MHHDRLVGGHRRICYIHDDVIKWKHFPRNWPFVREIHRSPVNFPHKGQWRGALMFSLIYAWINDWVNNREAGDLRRQHGHYDVIVMLCGQLFSLQWRHNQRDGVSNHQHHDCLLHRLFRQIKENSKPPRHWPLCGKSPVTGELPAQRTSYAENVSIWWCHHVRSLKETYVWTMPDYEKGSIFWKKGEYAPTILRKGSRGTHNRLPQKCLFLWFHNSWLRNKFPQTRKCIFIVLTHNTCTEYSHLLHFCAGLMALQWRHMRAKYLKSSPTGRCVQ